jgi:transcriptional regulator with XRE-family HTH domain
MNQNVSAEVIDDIKKAISLNIKKHREANHWTQEFFAEKLMMAGLADISINTISCAENGHTIPGLVTLLFMSRVFEITVDELVGC